MTELLRWNDAFSLGIAEIDHEHRELIDEINALHGALGSEPDPEEVRDCLGEILAHVAAHFALEEQHMRAVAYDAFESHKADHERLLDELQEMIEAVAASRRYEPVKLSEGLERWFAEHFRTHDARLHRFLAGR
jgi:hemerythrin